MVMEIGILEFGALVLGIFIGYWGCVVFSHLFLNCKKTTKDFKKENERT